MRTAGRCRSLHPGGRAFTLGFKTTREEYVTCDCCKRMVEHTAEMQHSCVPSFQIQDAQQQRFRPSRSHHILGPNKRLELVQPLPADPISLPLDEGRPLQPHLQLVCAYKERNLELEAPADRACQPKGQQKHRPLANFETPCGQRCPRKHAVFQAIEGRISRARPIMAAEIDPTLAALQARRSTALATTLKHATIQTKKRKLKKHEICSMGLQLC